ncbi:alcohol dehydrogenase [Dendrothele bispora CBS 962.96]|uniref:Alcohol dehydrogenase n=1 Tax=Dendrothele bispora (strain CBS 962.96) TaxID=1314807 RepID=A0A4S8LC05_DENBC|nr:alcohol dehydrogenase [Dendrothele bispora CBS 962.96]
MAPIRNSQVIFNEIPKGLPEPGKTTIFNDKNTIDPETVPLDGSFLVKVLVLSADPYMRGKMRPVEVPSYTPAYLPGKAIYGYGVGKVVKSDHSGFSKGDYVTSVMMDHAEYWVPSKDDFSTIKKFTPEPGLPLSVYLGAAGMPGRTAYIAWSMYAHAKKGQVCFVSAGAGPVGAFVIQLAKRDGMKVIASAGSDEKLRQCKEFGADVVFNYKTQSTEEVLAKEGPIDVYWDNVGGATLDAAFGNAALHARFIICGFITQYNSQEATPYKNIAHILFKRIIVSGFLVFDHEAEWEDKFYAEIPKLLASGQLKYSEDRSKGLEKSGEALLEVQVGKNVGKKIIVVADDD